MNLVKFGNHVPYQGEFRMKGFPVALMVIAAAVVLAVTNVGINTAWGAPPEDHLSVPKISGITPDSFRVDWVAYPAFNNRTHYQVRVDRALYYVSGFITSQMVFGMPPAFRVKVEVVTYHEGHLLGISSATWVLLGPPSPDPVFVTDVTSTTFRIAWQAVPTVYEYQIYNYPKDLLATVPASQTSIVLGPFTPGASMTVYIVSINPSSPSYPSKTVHIRLKPPSPKIEVAAADIGQTEFRLSWNSVDGATGYAVYKNGEPQGVTSATTTSFLVTGCLPGTVVKAKVIARNGTGDSEFSNEVNVLLKPSTPERPWATEVGSRSFVLNWKLVGGADSFKVWRDGEWLVANASSPLTSVRLSRGFNPGDTASMSISAYNVSGDSPRSEAASVTLLGGAGGTKELASTESLLSGFSGFSRISEPGFDTRQIPIIINLEKRGTLGDLLERQPGLVLIISAQPADRAALAGEEFSRRVAALKAENLKAIVLFQSSGADSGSGSERLFPQICEGIVPDLPRPIVLAVDSRGWIRSRSQETGPDALKQIIQESLWDCAPLMGPALDQLRREQRFFEGLHKF